MKPSHTNIKNTTKDDLIDWITFYKADIIEDGEVTNFSLCHTVDGQEIEKLVDVGRINEKTPESITEEIWNTAENDANTKFSGTPQRYVVYAYRDSEEPCAQIAFVRTSHSPLANRGSSSESPNEKGLMAQLMRQNEELHRMQMQLTEGVSGRLARDLEAERNRRMELEEKQFKVMNQYQELLDRTYERDLKRKEFEAGQERTNQIMGIVMSAAPHLLSKFLASGAGGTSAPALGSTESPGVSDPRIASFLESLNGEELQGILQQLSPDKREIMFRLYEEYRNNKQSNTKEEVNTEETEESVH